MDSPAPTRARLESIDLLRGLVMILMALDHVRDYLGAPGANPTDMATTTAPLFFTRWITLRRTLRDFLCALPVKSSYSGLPQSVRLRKVHRK
jgi:uncharacterized membrane protein